MRNSILLLFILLGLPAILIAQDISVGIDIIPPTCAGFKNGVIRLSPSGGQAPYQYQWSTGETSIGLFGIGAGTYSVTVTDANNQTKAIQDIVLTVPEPLAITVTTTDVCAEITQPYEASVTGGIPPYTFQWSNGQTGNKLSTSTPGDYFLTVTDANGCRANKFVKVVAPLVVSVETTPTLCADFCDASANAIVIGGTAPYRFLWNTGDTIQVLESLDIGTFTVTVTDANGCVRVATGETTGPPAIVIDLELTGTCIDEDRTATAILSGGVPPLRVRWSTGSTDLTIRDLIPGETYTINVTDANGCNTTRTFTVPSTPNLVVQINKQDIPCAAETGGQATAEVLGGVAPYTFLWSNGAITARINNLAEGEYSVTVTDANGCEGKATTKIRFLEGLDLNLSAVNATCTDSENGSANVVPIGGREPFRYRWSNGQTVGTAQNLKPGQYTVTVTDILGCEAVGQVTVGVENNINLALDIDQVGSSATITPSGGSAPYTYQWRHDSNVSGATATGLQPGVEYTVVVTDANGCTSTITFVFPGGAPIDVEVQALASCAEGNTGSASVSIRGGVEPYNIEWSNGATGRNIDNLPAGDYTVKVTDAQGNTRTIAFTVTPINVNVDFQITPQGCETRDGIIVATATGGNEPYRFQWSNGANTSTINNLVFGAYTLTVTDANGCVSQAMVEVPRKSIALETQVINASCQGGATGSATALPSGGTEPYEFAWSNGATTATISNVNPGFYEVTVKDATGCEEAAFITIGRDENLTLEATSTPADCNISNGTAVIVPQNGTAPFVYVWNNGAQTATLEGLEAGTYNVTVVDANGCQGEVQVVVDGKSINLATEISSASCVGGANGAALVTPSGGDAPYTFAWSNGASTAAISALEPGTYTVTVTDANGCEQTRTIDIEQLTIDVEARVQDISCSQNTLGAITITNMPRGTAPFNYAWSNGSNEASIDNLNAGAYSLTVSDGAGCTKEATFTINEGQAIEATLSASEACAGEPVDIIVSSDAENLTYQWLPANLFAQGTDTTANPRFIGTSDAIVTLTISNEIGCSEQFTLPITFQERVAPKVSDIIVEESCLGLIINFKGTPETVGYIWNFGNANDPQGTSTEIDPTYTYPTTGTYIVTLTPSEQLTCAAPAQFEVNVKGREELAFNIIGEPTICGDSTTTLAVNDPNFTSISWLLGENIVNSGSNFVAQAGNYTVIVENAEGCTGTKTIEVNNRSINVMLDDRYAACAGEPTALIIENLNQNDQLRYNWQASNPLAVIDNPNSESPSVTINQTTTFTTAISNQFGCSITKEIVVEVGEVPRIDDVIASRDTINLGQSVDLNVVGAAGNYTYNWINTGNALNNTSIPNPSATPNAPGLAEYTVQIESLDGCQIEARVGVLVLDLPCEPPFIFVPNVFTPNGDGNNDILYVRGFNIDRVHFRIFNRWGELVFETRDLRQGWDGTFKGQIAEGRVFGYVAEIECFGGDRNILQGNVTLLR
jgi:gliding motility-associated-like protein